MLAITVPLLEHHQGYGIYLASCACGLQNAMASAYSGSAVRTTHVSGMFTDLGIYLGHALRGIPVDMRRLRLSFTIISAFICGGIAGTVAFQHWAYATLYIPAMLTGSGALIYALYIFRKSRHL